MRIFNETTYSAINEKKIKEYYEKNPEGVPATKEIPEIYEMHQLLKQAVQNQMPKRLLDVGCGKGYTGQSVYKYCKKYYGFDISENVISIARRRIPKGKFVVGTIRKLPYPTNFFDCVVCSEVLEHIPDYPIAIKELSRVLKRGMRLIITTPNLLNPDMRWRLIFKGRYTSQIYEKPIHYQKLIKEFEKNHLEVKEYFSFFFLPIWGEGMSEKIKRPVMNFLKKVSRITNKPLGLYLFFNLENKKK